jgi:hypothetical protein
MLITTERKMKYQYNLTAIEPHKDEGFREMLICKTKSLEAVCHEILRYKKGKKPQNFKNITVDCFGTPIEMQISTGAKQDFTRDARFTREILIEEYKNELGQIEEVWETDYDFKGNDDIYVATYCKGWRKFVRDLIKEAS